MIITIGIYTLRIITYFNNPWCKYLKVRLLQWFIKYDGYIDNDITNLVCTTPDRTGGCSKALTKVRERAHHIFRISPRALVYCVLHKNREMLSLLKEYGYPLEMIECATNYSLVQKRGVPFTEMIYTV